MNVSTNEGTKEVAGEIKQWTGLCNMKVLAICPTMEQLKKINFAPSKEPVYIGSDNEGRPNMRVDFILRNAQINLTTKLAFFLQPMVRVNLNGDKTQYVNAIGQFTWGTEEGLTNTPDWYSKEGVRKAIVGEEKLILFIRNWCNVGREDSCGFSSLEEAMSVAKGNVTPLKGLLSAAAANEVKVLLGVKRDGSSFYQSVYGKYFGRSYTKGTTMWIKNLEDQYGRFDDDYQGSFVLQEYVGTPNQGPSVNSSIPEGIAQAQEEGPVF